MMTPEKEKQIASRILERAEIAQMTRQLRLNLGKANEKRKYDAGGNITESMRKVSPKRYPQATPQGGRKDSCRNTPPPPPPSRNSSNDNNNNNNNNISDNNNDDNVGRDPMTPKASKDDDLGADLLMYLATSPCASTTSKKKGPPSTPNGFSRSVIPVSSPYPYQLNDSPVQFALKPSHPATPARSELRFNMGDYVHNLFSPSPGFNKRIHSNTNPLDNSNGSNLLGGNLKPGRIIKKVSPCNDTTTVSDDTFGKTLNAVQEMSATGCRPTKNLAADGGLSKYHVT